MEVKKKQKWYIFAIPVLVFSSNDKQFGGNFEARIIKSFEMFQIFHTYKTYAKKIGFYGEKKIYKSSLCSRSHTTLALPFYTLISTGDALGANL